MSRLSVTVDDDIERRLELKVEEGEFDSKADAIRSALEAAVDEPADRSSSDDESEVPSLLVAYRQAGLMSR